MLEEISTAITISIPLLVFVLTELLISCGLARATIINDMVISLKISSIGKIFDLNPILKSLTDEILNEFVLFFKLL